ncbi:hypothetical protein JRQ81_014795 [Phrynocephalus forsythii]|uniref:Uncharacterized protein n=1 Tax=Phrynocephalus forsythii TaxID=171643 RepID=A0A9Q0XYD9_9SAUR|nr:hypothetical protein JRQ81_014795 [Phrynocephalus forsythii]
MTHRVLLKLDVMKHYEKKKLSKYDMTECRNLGKVQFNPYPRTPLLLDFKLDYDVKSNISEVPSTTHVMQCNKGSFHQRERLQSGSRAQINRTNYSGKLAVRPLSAPSYLGHKPNEQRGNLQSLDEGFMILKITSKAKPAHWQTMEVQKRGVPEQYLLNYLPTGTSRQDEAMIVTAEKDDTTDRSIICDEGSNQTAQEAPGSESQVKFCINGNLSSDSLKARKDNLLKGYITNKEGIKKSFVHYEDMDLKKKAYIPLCIEDEMEKPDAKVIRAGCPKKSHSPVTMSESFPVLHHYEECQEKYVLNRWLALSGNKAFYDINKRGEVCMHLNPVLQNNYNESIAIIGSRESPPPKVMAKRKKKPTLSGKPKRITIQVLSVEKAPCYVSAISQKTDPFLQKIHRRITRTDSRHSVAGRNIQQKTSESNKAVLMIHGVNPQSTKYPHFTSSGLVARVKSQLPIFWEKQFTSADEIRKKGRMVFVDYIPISKPIPIHRCGEELFDQAPKPPAIDDCTKVRAMETNQSESCNQDTLEQKPFLDENRSGDMDFTTPEHLSSIQKSRERPSRPTSSLSTRGFEAEENSFGAQKSRILDKHSEEKQITPSHCPVISIPTAQFETSELHRDQNMQEFSDIQGK